MYNRCRVIPNNAPLSAGYNTHQRGFATETHPDSNLTYVTFGMIEKNFSANLRVPQQPLGLRPEYYNGGCMSLYCDNSRQCPDSIPAVPSPEGNAMKLSLFTPSSAEKSFTVPMNTILGGSC